jgi:adenine specific DNA methylase Mod
VRESKKELVLALVAYDLGCSYFYNEEYYRATHCFTQYFKYAVRLQPSTIPDICMDRYENREYIE